MMHGFGHGIGLEIQELESVAAGKPAVTTARPQAERRQDWQRRVRFECDMRGVPLPLEYRQAFYARRVKPMVERFVAAMLLVLLAPVFLAAAIAIRLDGKGPIFFRQNRTGYLGRPFRLVKFRTMVPEAEALKASLRAQNHHASDSPDFKLIEDPRITRVGKFLRKTSIDELPNLINVLRGEMALVGPRPTSFDVGTYKMHHLPRLAARPGITGLWQVSGRANVDFDERTELDVDYIRSMSFANDTRLMFRTVGAVRRGDGAH